MAEGNGGLTTSSKGRREAAAKWQALEVAKMWLEAAEGSSAEWQPLEVSSGRLWRPRGGLWRSVEGGDR